MYMYVHVLVSQIPWGVGGEGEGVERGREGGKEGGKDEGRGGKDGGRRVRRMEEGG